MANQAFIGQFRTGTTVSRQELASRLRLLYPTAKPTTIDWHIYGLLQQGWLAKSGRGQYQVVDKAGAIYFWGQRPITKVIQRLVGAVTAGISLPDHLPVDYAVATAATDAHTLCGILAD